MRRRTALHTGILAAALAAGAALSCQLFIDVGGLSNGQCPAGQKLCSGHCQSQTDPRYGCNSPSCVPCEFVNSYAICDKTTKACVPTPGGCFGNYRTCSTSPDAACSIDIHHDVDNCGTCGSSCPDASNAIRGCMGGMCAVGGCTLPFEDCNQTYLDGCETNLSNDSANCGACGYACDAGGCHGGVCQALDAGAD